MKNKSRQACKTIIKCFFQYCYTAHNNWNNSCTTSNMLESSHSPSESITTLVIKITRRNPSRHAGIGHGTYIIGKNTPESITALVIIITRRNPSRPTGIGHGTRYLNSWSEASTPIILCWLNIKAVANYFTRNW